MQKGSCDMLGRQNSGTEAPTQENMAFCKCLTCLDKQCGRDIGPAPLVAGPHSVQYSSLQPRHSQSPAPRLGASEHFSAFVHLDMESVVLSGIQTPGHVKTAARDIKRHQVLDWRAA